MQNTRYFFCGSGQVKVVRAGFVLTETELNNHRSAPSTPILSPPQRPLCVTRRLGERKIIAIFIDTQLESLRRRERALPLPLQTLATQSATQANRS